MNLLFGKLYCSEQNGWPNCSMTPLKSVQNFLSLKKAEAGVIRSCASKIRQQAFGGSSM